MTATAKKKSPKKNLETKIRQVLESIRPMIQLDGGDVDFVSYDTEKNVLLVRLSGACQGCPMSEITLKQGIEQMIKDKLPQVKEVVTESY